MEITLPPSPESRPYPEPWKFIAERMRERGLKAIGNPRYRDKFSHQPDRYGYLDMEKIDRWTRTLTISKITPEELRSIHARENEKMYFLTSGEMKHYADFEYSGELSKQQVQKLGEFSDKCRPVPRKWQGISVPPYFELDNEFDGMEYHHAWDLAANMGGLVLPVGGKQRVSMSI